jgi:hypothetical protein
VCHTVYSDRRSRGEVHGSVKLSLESIIPSYVVLMSSVGVDFSLDDLTNTQPQ